MDATELLGSFEQDNKERFLKECFERYVPDSIKQNLKSGLQTEYSSPSDLLKFLPEHLHKYYNLIVSKQDNGHGKKLSLNPNAMQDSTNSTGAFRWIDSDLIKSIEDGSWVLIDDANNCPAAVLDRLNALVEPNGVMFLPECGDNSRIIQPHPEFRLILTYNNNAVNNVTNSGGVAGEISRAMRNRGTEIYILDNWFENDNDLESFTRYFELENQSNDDTDSEITLLKNLKIQENFNQNFSTQRYDFTITGLKNRENRLLHQCVENDQKKTFYSHLRTPPHLT